MEILYKCERHGIGSHSRKRKNSGRGKVDALGGVARRKAAGIPRLSVRPEIVEPSRVGDTNNAWPEREAPDPHGREIVHL